MAIRFSDKTLGNILLLTTGEPLLLEEGELAYLLLFGAESSIRVRIPEGAGKGLIWDQFGREHKTSVVLFDKKTGTDFELKGPSVRLGFKALEAQQYNLIVASGGSAVLSTQTMEVSGYSIEALSGAAVFLDYDSLEISQYSIDVSAGKYLLLTDNTQLLLTDGSGLYLEVQ